MKNTKMQRQQWKKREKLEKNPGMAADESQKQKRGDRWSKEWVQKKYIFASLMDLFHLKKSELEPQFQKYKGRIVLRGDNVERWFRIVCSIYWTRIISITDNSRKSSGYKIKTTAMRRTSSRCSIRIHPGQNGRCTVVTEKNPKLECPDFWIGLPKHRWPKSWSSMEDPVLPLDRNLYGLPLARLLWERQFEKVIF